MDSLSAALVIAFIFPIIYQALATLPEDGDFIAIRTILIIKQRQGEEQTFEILLQPNSHLSFCSSGLALRVRTEYLREILGEPFDAKTMDAYYYKSYEHITDGQDEDNTPNNIKLGKIGQYFYAKFQRAGMPSENYFRVVKSNGPSTMCRACTLVKESQGEEKEILGQIYYQLIQEYPDLTGYSSNASYGSEGGGDFVRTENPEIYYAFGID